MPTKFRARTVTAAFALAVTVAPMATVLPAGAEAPSHLTAGDAEAVLGTWGAGLLAEGAGLAAVVALEGLVQHEPRGRRQGCSPGARRRSDPVGSRCAVGRAGGTTYHPSRCATGGVVPGGLPEAARTVTGLRIRTPKGFARAFGFQVGTGRHAVKAETAVVARSGRAAEVATFRAFAQDVLPEKTLRALARRAIARLHNAS